jgi:tetratricopeptide (TPR) repeat protein
MPELIRKAGPGMMDAWRKVRKLIDENNTLANPLPEPYLARAELWAKVGNHEEALADQLRAVELLYKGSPSLLEQTRYLKRVQATLDKLKRMPRPYYPADADKLYYRGRTAFYQCDYEAAVQEFTESIRLQPEEPLYWYYRALAYKKLGKTDEADRDARVAGSLHRDKKSTKDLGRELERIQGGLRHWLTVTGQQRISTARR